MTVERCPVHPGTDLTDPDLVQQRVPLPEFAWLRENRPLYWNPQSQEDTGFTDGGLWIATRHADVKAISSARTGWSSGENTAIVRFTGEVGADLRAMQRQLLLNMDGDHHTRVRGIVSRGVFTPKGVSRIEGLLRDRAERIVLAAKEKGTGDFVDDVACELPLQALADLMGFPQEDRRRIFDWSNQMIGSEDPDFEVDPELASAELLGYAATLGEARRACPAEDLVTRLVAGADDDILTSEEFAWFVLILAVAGNETTRNAITHGMAAFLSHPEEWERYRAERPPTTADEIVRWATPVILFQRTATVDHEVHGTRIDAGQRVGLVYSSANFDETVFEDPTRFDIGRDPNPHVGFGGGGAHYCVGANLAKLEIDVMFDAIATHLPDIASLGEPARLRTGWLNGLKRFPVSYS